MRSPLARQPVRAEIRARFQTKPFLAPVGGWVTAKNLAQELPNSALIMDNWIPTQKGIKLRGGTPRYATLDETGATPVESMMNYTGPTPQLFAATETEIFDITSVIDPETEFAAEVTGQTSGYYSFVNFSTSGGYFMPVVNGTDSLLMFDGTNFYPTTGTILYALNYDAETTPFTEGETLTGGTSSDTATIVKVIDNGTTGTLWVNNATGTFTDNETITDGAGGSATADGVTTSLVGAITGVNTADLIHVSVYRNRIYYVEGGSLNVWYLPAGAITGAASSLSLSGIFGKGGTILFTETWSMDAGDGLDDKLVVVSTQGEVAVFEGSNPGDANTWSLVGRYDTARPLGKNCYMRAGGDLIIGTVEGAIPVSAAVNKDPGAISLSAISKPIEPDWTQQAVQRATLPWEVVKWNEQNLAVWSLPKEDDQDEEWCYIVNLETGAWARWTGFNTRCLGLHQGQAYFGTNEGTIRRFQIGGFDDIDTPYVSQVAYNWDHMGMIGYEKAIKQARATFVTASPFTPKLSVSTNYTQEFPAAPDAAVDTTSPGVWDVGLWDQATWDAGLEFYTVVTRWRSIGRNGYSISPEIQVTNGVTTTPTAELVVLELTYSTGGLQV